MKKFIWSIPGLSIYIYTITILTQAGYYSYFNIPTSFISASISENIIFLYILLKAIFTLAISIGYWWILIIIATISIFSTFFIRTSTITTIFSILLITSIFGFYGLGEKLAQNNVSFYTIDNVCITSTSSSDRYIIPLMKDNISVVLPINIDNKIIGEFFVRNTSNLSCKIEYKNIGKIIK